MKYAGLVGLKLTASNRIVHGIFNRPKKSIRHAAKRASPRRARMTTTSRSVQTARKSVLERLYKSIPTFR